LMSRITGTRGKKAKAAFPEPSSEKSDYVEGEASAPEPILALPPGKMSKAEKKYMSSMGRSLSSESLNLMRRIKGARSKKSKEAFPEHSESEPSDYMGGEIKRTGSFSKKKKWKLMSSKGVF